MRIVGSCLLVSALAFGFGSAVSGELDASASSCSFSTMNLGDVDCSGQLDAVDLAMVIDAVFFGLDPATGFCDPFPLLANEGFEAGLTDWVPYQYASGWNASVDNPSCGFKSARFGFPTGSGYYDAAIKGTPISVQAGVPYCFSFWIRETDTRDTFDPNSTIFDPVIYVAGKGYDAPHPQPSPTWQLVDTTFVFEDSGDADVQFQIHGYAMSDSAESLIDHVILVRIVP